MTVAGYSEPPVFPPNQSSGSLPRLRFTNQQNQSRTAQIPVWRGFGGY